jgi:hypothetical protein
MYLSSLFDPEPVQWGLRGDPVLWSEMRKHFEGTRLPVTLAELESVVSSAFCELTGHRLDEASRFHVAKYETYGMSSGLISPKFWREYGLPLLRERLSKMN